MPHDMAEVVSAAKAEMDRLIQLGRLQGDPLRHPIEALAVHLDAMHRLQADAAAIPDEVTLRVAPLLAEIKSFTAAAREPRFTPSQVDTLGRHLASRCAAALEWRSTTIFLATLLAGTLAGGIIDRFLLPAPPEPLTCGAMLADGSRQPICYRLDGPPPASQDMPQQPAAPAAKTKVK
jgi:hypothetical protein